MKSIVMLMQNLKALFWHFASPDYLFNSASAVMTKSDHVIYYLGIILLVLGAVMFFAARSGANYLVKAMRRRWADMCLVIGFLLLVWSTLRYEWVRYLSARIFWFIILASGLIWTYRIIKYQFGQYRRDLVEYAKDQIKKKYM